ncbi:MAG: prolyl oligopeptidase family serine peptidase [Armatimonadota bacterium]
MHYTTTFIIIALVFLLSAAAFSAQVDAVQPKSCEITKGFLMKTVKVSGKSIKYVAYVPPTYDPKKPAPTIVFLNGAGECGTDGLRQIVVGLGSAVMTDVEKWPFIILFPQKQTVKSNWEDEDAMVMAILAKTKKELNVDSSRLYLTGLSQGGHGTWAIAAKHPDIFAAIAPICGWGDETIAKKLTKMPVWAFHGDADEAVPVAASVDMKKNLEAAGGSCRLTIYPGVGHNSWDKGYRDEFLAEWFLQYHK